MKLFLKVAIVVFAVFQGVAVASNMTADALSEVQSQMELLGSASVIVEYDSPAISTKSLNGLVGVTLKQQVSTIRNGFMLTLERDLLPTIRHEYDYLPGLVSEVSQSQLDKLRNNPNVKNIYANKQRKTTLLESVDLVYPTKERLKLDGGDGWTTAIIDTGVHRGHSFFETNGASRVISEACYSGGGFDSRFTEIDRLCPGNARVATSRGAGEDCTGYDGCDHGTHVAGIAAGNGGVASGANIIAIQVFTGIRDVFRRDVCGIGVGRNCISAFDSDIIAGLERVYALRNTFKIASVNMSLGGGRASSTCDGMNRLFTNIVNRLKTAGIATVVSSGNNGFTTAISFPACISNAIAVGATSDFTGDVFGNGVIEDERVFYSNSSGALDLYAPGTLIRSSVPNNSFANFNGTSMASPHVAGAFAVFRQGKADASVAEIEGILKSVGPTVTIGNVTRRRLDMIGVLEGLGVSIAPPIAPMMFLLDEDE